MTVMDGAGEEDYRERRAVVFDQLADVPLEKIAFPDHTTCVRKAEDQQRDGDGKKS